MVELRGDEKRRYVGGLFARIARRYDMMNTVMTFGMDGRWRRLAALRATQDCGGLALDVATGTGELALELSHINGVTQVVGVDLLEPMVKQAVEKDNVRHRQPTVSFVLGDALHLPFPNDTFNCVTSAFSLRNVPDLEASLREMIRVVRPGGRVLSLETMLDERGPTRSILKLYFNVVVPLFGWVIARDRPAYKYLARSVADFHSAKGFTRLLEDIGLSDVSHRSLGMGAVHLHWGTKKAT